MAACSSSTVSASDSASSGTTISTRPLRVVCDPRVTRWLSFDSLSREQQAERLIGAIERAAADPRTEWYLAVTTRTDDVLVGFVRIGLSGVRGAKLGYAIAPIIGPTGSPPTPPSR